MPSVNRSLATLLAVSTAALLAGCKKDPECFLPEIQCGDACVNGSTDPTNCGGCGVVCGPGQTCCGSCVDVLSDERNCGGCRLDCGIGTCTAGSCECTAGTHCPSDPYPWCRDTTSDEAHCGACGNACTFPGSQCQGSVCGCFAPDPVECTSAVTTVPACTDLHDPDNCGTCGESCRLPGKTCTTGACACSSGLTDCGPAGCFDLQTDEAHCGACVASACTPGQRCCGAGCRDVATDEANCGTCGNVCAVDRVCTSGACVCATPKPVTCGSNCCAGTGCCPGNACQTPHGNGLGQVFFDCTPTYTPGTTNREAAVRAAQAWGASAVSDATFCDPFCLAGQKPGQCAIWCHGSSPVAGRVRELALPSCNASACPNGATSPTWPTTL